MIMNLRAVPLQNSLIGRAGASPPSRTAAIIYLFSVVRRALNLLRASFSPIFQYFSAVNVTRLSFSLTCMPYMAPCAMDSLAVEGAVHSHSDFRVRRSVVYRALNWLVTHNQYCRSNHVHIDVNPLQQLPHDGNLSTSLPSLLRTPSLNLLPPTLLQLVLLSPTPLQLLKIHYSAHLPQSFVPIATRSMTEQEAVHQSVQERQLSPSISSSPATMMWPLLEEYPSMSSPPRATHLQQLATNRQRRLESEMAEESYTRLFFSAISIFLPYIRSCNVC